MKCQGALDDLQKAVVEKSILALSDINKAFKVHTDASDFAIGGVLMQGDHPIVYENVSLVRQNGVIRARKKKRLQ